MLNTSQSYRAGAVLSTLPASGRIETIAVPEYLPALEDGNIYEAARYHDSGAVKREDLNMGGLTAPWGSVNDVANRVAGWATGRGVRGRASQGLEG